MQRRLYAIYLLYALTISYVISQLGFLATLITVALTVPAVILWRNKRPQDFTVQNYLLRVFVACMYALVFFAGYLILRKTQPMNYRANNLAAIGVASFLLAIYFGTTGKKTTPS